MGVARKRKHQRVPLYAGMTLWEHPMGRETPVAAEISVNQTVRLIPWAHELVAVDLRPGLFDHVVPHRLRDVFANGLAMVPMDPALLLFQVRWKGIPTH